MSNVHALELPSVRDRVSEEEWQMRVDLAACYRLVAHYGWDDILFTHNSARIPGTDHHFLINPMGLKFEEITASSLIKIDCDGNKIMESPFGYIKAGFTIHSAIHMNREDAVCVMHTHTMEGMAVSAQKDGLLMLNQKSLCFYNRLAYHDYEGIADDLEERDRLAADLGDLNSMMLWNHGLLTVGNSVANAFILHKRLNDACQLQLMAQAGGGELRIVPEDVCEKTALQFEQNYSSGKNAVLQWDALRRMLDRIDPGYAE
ncbi:class II aldolase/adducin family protein [Thalassospiraceae bacterium LMO-JJ14]|nr:class II aldolase/adducin family protein [Thalassospiraceae bacterium LMO-JJ14]